MAGDAITASCAAAFFIAALMRARVWRLGASPNAYVARAPRAIATDALGRPRTRRPVIVRVGWQLVDGHGRATRTDGSRGTNGTTWLHLKHTKAYR